jgi:hypothetical protein
MTSVLHNALDTISKEQVEHAMAIGFLLDNVDSMEENMQSPLIFPRLTI